MADCSGGNMGEPTRKKRATDNNQSASNRGLLTKIATYFGNETETASASQTPKVTADPVAESVGILARNLSIALTPMAYQLLYAHVTGERPDVTIAIDGLRQAGQPVSADMVAQLHERYFGAELESQAVYDASRNVERLLSIVQDELETAQDKTAKHGKAITELNDQLGEQSKIADIRRLVAAIVNETSGMRMSINKLERRVIQGSSEIAILRDNLAKAQEEANSDPLTGIANRKLLEMTMRRQAKEADTDDTPFSILLLDIDHFKSFNDEYGHQIGDAVLKTVAHCCHQSIKARDLAARYGGEEIAIVLAETKQNGAVSFAEKLREAIQNLQLKADDIQQEVRRVTVSIGVGQYRNGEPLKRLVGRADRALYKAKEEGRNCVRCERDIEVIGRPKVKA